MSVNAAGATRVGEADEQVVVVDASDHALGSASKLEVHRTGALHRAVSVLVTDGAGNVLLQRRAAGKYHSAGLWTNTCCGHPRPEEPAAVAAARRLDEEMGVRCALQHAGTFRYRAALEQGLVEHEIDHVFVGCWTGEPSPDPREASTWRWAPAAALHEEVRRHPERYTAWLERVLEISAQHPLLRGPGAARDGAVGPSDDV